MKNTLLQTTCLSLAFVFLSCSAWPVDLAYAAPERPTENIRVQLKWLHQFQFAGFYAAIEKGYYQAEGIEVILQEGYPGLVPAEAIARDEVQFAVDTPSAMIQRQKGLPVVLIAAIFQHSPTIVLSRNGSGIETPHDLIGKRVMVLADSDPEFLAMLAAEGVRSDQVTLVPHTFKLDEIVAGKVDAQTAYATNEPRLMDKRGLKYGVLRPSRYAIDFYGDSLITSERIARERPELVERFLRATRQGWVYAMDHPQEIAEVILTRYHSKKSREDLLAEAESMRELVQPSLIEVGHMNPERWRQIAEIFVKFNMLDHGFSVDKMIYQNVRAEISDRDRRLLIISVSSLGVLLLLGCAVGVVLLVFNKRMASQVALRTSKLNESENRQRALFAAVSDPVLVANRDTGILVECNTAAERYFGRSRGQLIGSPQRDLHPPETPQVDGVTEDFKRVAIDPGHTEEVRLLAAGGAVRYVEVTASTFEIAESRLILGVFRDVTERKRAEETLRESEERFRNLFENAPLAYQSLDENGRFLDVNRKWLAALGYESKEQVIGRWFGDFLAPGSREHFDINFPMFKQACMIDGVEFEMLRKGGGSITVSFNGRVQTDREGRFMRTHCIFTDITERKNEEIFREMGREILNILNEPGNLRESIKRLLDVLKAQTGADAVGLRLREGEDFPYFVQDGFSNDFLLTENSLLERGKDGGVCRDKDGSARLECTCGLVISGKTDQSNPLFTQGGSFWTNDSFPLLELPSDQDPRLHPRNKCVHQHYASVALIPIRTNDQIVGLIQINDRRKGLFSTGTIEILESIAAHVGSALMRKQAEESLRESEARFKALHNASFGGITIHERGRILDCNQGLSDISGYSYEELIGMDGLLLIAEKSRELVMGNILAGYEKPYEAFGLRKNGEVYPLRLEARNIPYQGRSVRAVEFRDTTESKKIEEALLLAKDAANAANLAKSEFLANMSHEIRTPLNGVLGMLQLIRGSEVTGAVESYAEMGLRAGQRLTSLLEDILDLSRIEAGRMPIASKPFSFTSIFTALAETFSPMHYSKSLSLEICASPDVPADVVGDEIRVRQILFNLVGNAMKFSDKGEVRVEVSPLLPLPSGQARLLFVVSDSGPGIPDGKVGQICAPFVQVSSDFTRAHQGAGLGLSIARKLVDAMGGTLTFESAEGQGTSVYLMLPFGIPADSSIPATPESVPDADAGAPLRLLLVEDEEISRLSACLHLERLGHQVVTANSGEEALEALRASRYDCVLMDIQMDVMDGLAATRAIRSGACGVLDAQVPIVAMTAYAMSGDRERFLDAGMNDYVAKPVQVDELKKALERVRQ